MKRTLPGLAMSALVLGAALFAFRRARCRRSRSPRSTRTGCRSTAARAGARIVAVGERGVILLSDDAGAHWRPASTAPDHASTLTQVRFITPTLGIAVGHDGRIVRSDDAGLHWRDVHMDHAHADPLLSVWGTAGGPLFAAGSFGQLLRSDDAGLTWQTVKTRPATVT